MAGQSSVDPIVGRRRGARTEPRTPLRAPGAEQAAQAKLDAFVERSGRRPNVL